MLRKIKKRNLSNKQIFAFNIILFYYKDVSSSQVNTLRNS